MEYPNEVTPLEELPSVLIDLEDTKPLPIKPMKPKIDPDVYIKFISNDKGKVIAKLMSGDRDKEYRIVPLNVKLSLVYPTKIKSSLWNSFETWSQK